MPLAASDNRVYELLENLSIGGALVIVAGFALIGFLLWLVLRD